MDKKFILGKMEIKKLLEFDVDQIIKYVENANVNNQKDNFKEIIKSIESNDKFVTCIKGFNEEKNIKAIEVVSCITELINDYLRDEICEEDKDSRYYTFPEYEQIYYDIEQKNLLYQERLKASDYIRKSSLQLPKIDNDKLDKFLEETLIQLSDLKKSIEEKNHYLNQIMITPCDKFFATNILENYISFSIIMWILSDSIIPDIITKLIIFTDCLEKKYIDVEKYETKRVEKSQEIVDVQFRNIVYKSITKHKYPSKFLDYKEEKYQNLLLEKNTIKNYRFEVRKCKGDFLFNLLISSDFMKIDQNNPIKELTNENLDIGSEYKWTNIEKIYKQCYSGDVSNKILLEEIFRFKQLNYIIKNIKDSNDYWKMPDSNKDGLPELYEMAEIVKLIKNTPEYSITQYIEIYFKLQKKNYEINTTKTDKRIKRNNVLEIIKVLNNNTTIGDIEYIYKLQTNICFYLISKNIKEKDMPRFVNGLKEYSKDVKTKFCSLTNNEFNKMEEDIFSFSNLDYTTYSDYFRIMSCLLINS